MSNAIQVLRGVFVLSVFLFHLNETVFINGFLGVDAFFVISGFVITPMLCRIFGSEPKSRISASRLFLKKRFFRLFPALIFTTSITCFIVFIFGDVSDHKETAQLAITSLFSISNFFAYQLQGNYFLPNPNPLLHTWSLSVEWQIYLIMLIISFLLSILLFAQSDRTRLRIYFFAYIVVFVVSIFIFFKENTHKSLFSVFGIEDSGSFLPYYSPLSRLWEFCCGGIVYFLRTSCLENWFRKINSLYYTNFISSVLLMFLISPLSIGIKRSTVSIIVLTSLALLLLPQKSSLNLNGALGKVFTFLGDRSYSIYLIHLPVIYLFRDNFDAFSTGSLYAKIVIYFLVFLFIVFFAHIQFSLIEKPFRLHTTKLKLNRLKQLSLHFEVRVGLLLLSILTIILPAKISEMIFPKDELFYQSRFPWDWSPDCKIISSDSMCVFGGNKSPRILVIGDSTAAVMSLGLSQIATEGNFRITVFTHASCPFLLSPQFLKDSRATFPGDACLEHNRKIIKFVLEENPEFVLYQQRSYLSDFRTMLDNNYIKEIVENLKNLGGGQAKVVIVGITPEIAVPDSVFDLIKLRSNLYRVTENAIARKEELLFSKESKSRQIHYISIRNIFCKGVTCSSYSNAGRRLYFDSWHLNEFGSRKISEVLRQSSILP